MLAQFYPPILGGTERHVASLAAALAAHRHSVSVVTLWHQGLPTLETDGLVRVYRVRGTVQHLASLFTVDRQHAPPFPDPGVTLALRRILAVEKPQIVHAHNWMVHSFLPLKAWSHARLVMTLHDSGMTCVQMRRMFRDVELCNGPARVKCLQCSTHHYGIVKGIATLAGNGIMNGFERSLVDVFLPVSQAVAETSQLAGKGASFQVVPNFVPDDVAVARDDSDPRLAALPSQQYILQVGDLTHDKGIDCLLAAYAGLSDAPPLVLIGRWMEDTPRQMPSNVRVIEGLPHPLVMQAWQRSLFGVVPSLCLDAFPTVTLEAMASGRAVIGSRIGGIIDQIADGETGFLVPPGDAQALRHAMARLIAEPALRTRLGQAAEKRVARFKASTVVRTIESLYESLCPRPQS